MFSGIKFRFCANPVKINQIQSFSPNLINFVPQNVLEDAVAPQFLRN